MRPRNWDNLHVHHVCSQKLRINKMSQYKSILCPRKTGQKTDSIDAEFTDGHLSAKFGSTSMSFLPGQFVYSSCFSFPHLLLGLTSQTHDCYPNGSTTVIYDVCTVITHK